MRAELDKSKPVVLMATAERWTSTARLAQALQSLGCEVVLVAPGDHPATACGAAGKRFRYDPLRPLHSLRKAIRATLPAAILPADEIVTCQLGELWADAKGRAGESPEFLGALLRHSLGDPERLCDTGSRMGLYRAAKDENIPTPDTIELQSAGDLAVAMRRLGCPLVLKADATSGGRGVRVVVSLEEAERAYRAFSVAPHMPRAILHGIRHRDWTHVRTSARRERRGVSAQRMIHGVERNAMAVVHQGEVLALQCFEVVHTWKERGPSSVLRRIDDAAMEHAARTLARRQKITGFCGFDFIVDPVTGTPLLLECNARPTQLAHLPLGPGHDLVAAYVRRIVGLPEVHDRMSATARELVALFPQELQRDPESPALREAFHDVPWGSPALLYRALRGDNELRAALIAQSTPAQRARESAVALQATR